MRKEYPPTYLAKFTIGKLEQEGKVTLREGTARKWKILIDCRPRVVSGS